MRGEDVELKSVTIIFKSRQSSVPSDLETIKSQMKHMIVNPKNVGGGRGKKFKVSPDSSRIDKYVKIIVDNHNSFTLDEED